MPSVVGFGWGALLSPGCTGGRRKRIASSGSGLADRSWSSGSALRAGASCSLSFRGSASWATGLKSRSIIAIGTDLFHGGRCGPTGPSGGVSEVEVESLCGLGSVESVELMGGRGTNHSAGRSSVDRGSFSRASPAATGGKGTTTEGAGSPSVFATCVGGLVRGGPMSATGSWSTGGSGCSRSGVFSTGIGGAASATSGSGASMGWTSESSWATVFGCAASRWANSG